MKSKMMKCITVMMLLSALTIPARLAAQNHDSGPPTYSVLYTFTGGTDGGGTGDSPFPVLVRDEDGNLYGTRVAGGDLSCPYYFQPGCGVVFKLDRSGNESVLYSFTGGADGNGPSAALLRDRHGNLYGTTFIGGLGAGVVFKVDRMGNETVLYTFTGGADGASPYSNLIRDEDGNLYGTAPDGGSFGRGVVFKLNVAGNETVLYSFTGHADGRGPYAGLVRDEDGNLYGTTAFGGQGCRPFGCGVVFKLDPNGNETVLYSFTGGADGGTPWAGLIRDEEGNLYGTGAAGGDLSGCSIGGGFGCGVVFKLDPHGNQTVLYSFTGTDGYFPYAVLVRDEKGNLYGTTESGGDLSGCGGSGCGVVFKLDRSGKQTVLYSFTGTADGAFPEGLLLDKKGTLYGITENGGDFSGPCTYGCGVVFKLSVCDGHDGNEDCGDNRQGGDVITQASAPPKESSTALKPLGLDTQQQGPAQDSANAGSLTIITFDVPGSTWTLGTSINPAGVIAGFYTSANHYHGFLRAVNGTFTTFDVPGAVNTNPNGINPAGAVTGDYFENGTHGFLRAADSTITTFDPPGSTFTFPVSINQGGSVTGSYRDANGVQHGFLRAANGTFTGFDPAGAKSTAPSDINTAGAITGSYQDANGVQHGFLRAADGTITPFDPPGGKTTSSSGINTGGAITGSYCNDLTGATARPCHGFLRAATGTFTSFDPTGSVYTTATSINDGGVITGSFSGQTLPLHGFVRAANGTITAFDVPGATQTTPSSINPSNEITGNWYDGSAFHGFLVTGLLQNAP